MLVVADADGCACSLRTEVEITLSTATSTMSDMSNDLPKSRNEQRRTQHTLSAVVQMALLMRLRGKSDYHPRALAQGIGAMVRCS